jgi:putative ABC transport system substrate-binding protein
MRRQLRRREFIAFLGSGSFAIALASSAVAQARMARIGYLASLPPTATPDLLRAFREGLSERGYVEGQNVEIISRSAAQWTSRWRPSLLRSRSTSSLPGRPQPLPRRAAQPRRFRLSSVGIADPIGAGFITSLSQPGGNVTGTTNLSRDLGGKPVELLREIVPSIHLVFVLRNPRNPASSLQLQDVEVAVRTMGLQLAVLEATLPDDLDKAFARMTSENAKGAITLADPLLISQRARIASLAQSARLPVVFSRRENVEAGGLISYGPSLRDQFRGTAIFVDKLLKGANPAELPVEQPTRLDLIANLKTANALGLTLPPTILARADEVIE